MKKVLLSTIVLMGFAVAVKAQVCCNVVNGHGGKVVTTNGICVVATRLAETSPCDGDADNDGITDSKDQCPEVAGLAEFNGCLPPDADKDGIVDSKDNCPNVFGTINGCPDSDSDGIIDSEDECPKISGTLKGCPDTDSDGVKDSSDACPKIAGLSSLKGCPDADADGIADGDDKCPNIAGIKANKGCPEISEETKEILKSALEGVKFRSGSDVLTGNSTSKLDKVVEVMNNNPVYKLKISGYTDNTGNPESNLTLSDKRAHASEQYLIKKGIDPKRISAKGYGITNPIDDNNTAAGRSHNRRVEFEIVY